MSVPYPSPEQLKEAAAVVGLSLTDDDVQDEDLLGEAARRQETGERLCRLGAT